MLGSIGRVTGYELDYGYPYSGAPGIAGVSTSIEQYRSPADAKLGLAFWKKEDAGVGSFSGGGFTATSSWVHPPRIGSHRFAYRTGYSASNVAPLTMVDERFTDSRYVLEVVVSAGTASAAESLAPQLAKKLVRRLRFALEGRLKRKPVKLPPKQKLGPPAGGPDLSALALTTSDIAQDTPSLLGEGYVIDPLAVSDYSVGMDLGFQGITQGILDQEIEWYPNENAAAFNADLVNAIALSSNDPSRTHVVDLSSLGYGALGSVFDGTGDPTISTGTVVFSTGQLDEFLFFVVQGGIGTQDPVTYEATAAAAHLTAVLGP